MPREIVAGVVSKRLCAGQLEAANVNRISIHGDRFGSIAGKVKKCFSRAACSQANPTVEMHGA
jgi:hypothetical protein